MKSEEHVSKGHRPALVVRARAASELEAKRMAQALGGLLTELVRQDLVLGRKSDDNNNKQSE